MESIKKSPARVYSPDWWKNEFRREKSLSTDEIWGGEGGLGAIDETKPYIPGDVVGRNGTLIQANQPIEPGPYDATQWDPLNLSADVVIPEFSNTDSYIKDQPVRYDGHIYFANLDLGAGSWNRASWTGLLAPETNIAEWVIAEGYTIGNLARVGTSAYMAITTITAGTPFDVTQWLELTAEVIDPDDVIVGWEPNKEIKEDQLVYTAENIFYRATADFTTPAVFTTTNLAPVKAAGSEFTLPHTTTKAYATGAPVYRDGGLWYAQTNIPVNSPWDYSQWLNVLSDTSRAVAYRQGRGYVTGSLIMVDGLLRISNKAVAIDAAFDDADWDSLVEPKVFKGLYDPLATYEIGNYVDFDDDLYRCTTAVTAPEAFTVARWQIVSNTASQFKGYFKTTDTYAVNDVVVQADMLYRCTTAVTAPGAFVPASWTYIGERNIYRGDHDDANTYVVGEVVYNSGLLYRCKVDNTGAFDISNWDTVEARTSFRGTYSDADTYEFEDVVVFANELYVANVNIAAAETFTPAKWDIISRSAYRGFYNFLSTYELHDLAVSPDGFLTRCITAIPTAELFTPAKWQAVTDVKTIVGNYDNLAEYLEFELVVQNGSLYRSKADKGTGAWNEAEWDRLSISAVTAEDHNPLRDYREFEVTVKDGLLYRAKAAVTAGLWDEADWDTLGAASKFSGLFDATKDYKADDLVYSPGYGNLLRAKADVTAGAFDETDWEDAITPDETTLVPLYADNEDYLGDQAVRRNDFLYIAKADFTPTVWDDNDWIKLGGGIGLFRGPFDAAATYELHEMVYSPLAAELLRCTVPVTTPTAFSINNWQRVSNAKVRVPVFDVSRDYTAGELVISGNLLYRAPIDFTATAPFSAGEWTYIGVAPSRFKGDYDDGATYKVADFVYEASKGLVYRCITEVTVGETFDPVKWEATGADSTFKGIYKDTVTYAVDDIIVDRVNLDVYICDTAVTVAEPFDGLKWSKLSEAEANRFKGTYSNLKDYAVDDIVWKVDTGQLIRCVSAITGPRAFTPADWQFLSKESTLVPWEPNTNFTKDQLVYDVNDRIYRVDAPFTSPAIFDTNNLTDLRTSTVFRGTYEATETYTVGEFVEFDNLLYRCNSAVVVAEAFTPVKWGRIGERSSYRGDHQDTGVLYDEGDIVYDSVDNRLLRCTVPVTAGPIDLDNWEPVSPGILNVTVYKEDAKYKVGDMIREGSNLLIANKAINPAPAIQVLEDWDPVSTSSLMAPTFDATKDYEAGEIFREGGELYASLDAVAANAFNIGDFVSLTKRTIIRPDYASGQRYEVGDIIVHEDKLRRANMVVDLTLIFIPFSESSWDTLSHGRSLARGLIGGESYEAGELVFHNGEVYRLLVDTTMPLLVPNTLGNIFIKVGGKLVFEEFDFGSAYTVGQGIMTADSLLIANKDIAANGMFDSRDWDTIGERNRYRGTHNPLNSYNQNDLVLVASEGTLFSAKADNTAGLFDIADWDAVGSTNAFKGNHSNTVDYAENDVVIHDLSLFRASAAIPAKVFDEADWDPLSAESTFRGRFSATESYALWEVVYNDSEDWRLFACTTAITVGKAWDETDWTELTPSTRNSFRGTHSTTTDYLDGDIVIHQRNVYMANGDVLANSFLPADWIAVGRDIRPVTQLSGNTDETRDYVVGQVLIKPTGDAFQLYRCLDASTGVARFTNINLGVELHTAGTTAVEGTAYADAQGNIFYAIADAAPGNSLGDTAVYLPRANDFEYVVAGKFYIANRPYNLDGLGALPRTSGAKDEPSTNIDYNDWIPVSSEIEWKEMAVGNELYEIDAGKRHHFANITGDIDETSDNFSIYVPSRYFEDIISLTIQTDTDQRVTFSDRFVLNTAIGTVEQMPAIDLEAANKIKLNLFALGTDGRFVVENIVRYTSETQEVFSPSPQAGATVLFKDAVPGKHRNFKGDQTLASVEVNCLDKITGPAGMERTTTMSYTVSAIMHADGQRVVPAAGLSITGPDGLEVNEVHIPNAVAAVLKFELYFEGIIRLLPESSIFSIPDAKEKITGTVAEGTAPGIKVSSGVVLDTTDTTVVGWDKTMDLSGYWTIESVTVNGADKTEHFAKHADADKITANMDLYGRDVIEINLSRKHVNQLTLTIGDTQLSPILTRVF